MNQHKLTFKDRSINDMSIGTIHLQITVGVLYSLFSLCGGMEAVVMSSVFTNHTNNSFCWKRGGVLTKENKRLHSLSPCCIL